VKSPEQTTLTAKVSRGSNRVGTRSWVRVRVRVGLGVGLGLGLGLGLGVRVDKLPNKDSKG
jgi:hypothetical protein